MLFVETKGTIHAVVMELDSLFARKLLLLFLLCVILLVQVLYITDIASACLNCPCVPTANRQHHAKEMVTEVLHFHTHNLHSASRRYHPGDHPNSNTGADVQHITYPGLPSNEYLARARVVFDSRAVTWTTAGGNGSSCNWPGQRCSMDLHCVGPEIKKECRSPVPSGGACDTMFNVCQTELSCQDGICRSRSWLHEKCSVEGEESYHFAQCEKGFFCDPHAHVCQAERKAGDYCTDVYRCEEGLVCDMQVCRTEQELKNFEPYLVVMRKLTFKFSQEFGCAGFQKYALIGIICGGEHCGKMRLMLNQHYGLPDLTGTQALTPFVSAGNVSCPPHMVVNSVFCRLAYCAEIGLACAYMKPSFRVSGTDVKETRMKTDPFARMRCPEGYYLQGVRCSGEFCEGMGLTCVYVERRKQQKSEATIPVLLGGTCNIYSSAGYNCHSNFSCQGGVCVNGMQGCSFPSHEACPEDSFCRESDSICTRRYRPGKACDDASQCEGNLACDFGTCWRIHEPAAYIPLTYTTSRLVRSIEFSDETPGRSARQHYLIAGVQCKGEMCDIKQLLVREHVHAPDLVGEWLRLGFVSSRKMGGSECPPRTVVTTVICKFALCEAVSLACARPKATYLVETSPDAVRVSEFHGNGLELCPNGYYMNGFTCTGSTCEQFKLKCVLIKTLESLRELQEMGLQGP